MKPNPPSSCPPHSLRLKGYDYTCEGLYFITICTKDRQHYFGKVTNGEMVLKETGKVTESFLKTVSDHFNHAMVSDYVVMPNHVHLILNLNDKRKFASLTALMDIGTRHDAETCHGVSLPLYDQHFQTMETR